MVRTQLKLLLRRLCELRRLPDIRLASVLCLNIVGITNLLWKALSRHKHYT